MKTVNNIAATHAGRLARKIRTGADLTAADLTDIADTLADAQRRINELDMANTRRRATILASRNAAKAVR